jgi:prepilin-type N-terminal cleavage/methylation domain-containing protein
MTRVKGQGSRVKKATKGFTLLEVMVAVVIMATVLVSLIGLKNRSMQDVLLAEHITTGTMLAKRMMVETIAKKPQTVEEEGDFPDEENYMGYTWKRTVANIPLPNGSTIMEVRIAILWKEGTRQELVELVSYE